MSCQQKPGKTGNYSAGVTGIDTKRTKYDLDQIKKYDTSKIPDYIGSKRSIENYCACSGKGNKKSTTFRTLAFDNPYNPNSYNVHY